MRWIFVNEDVFNLQDILMVAIERLQCPLHVGDFCPPGHPPSQIIGKCWKNSLQVRLLASVVKHPLQVRLLASVAEHSLQVRLLASVEKHSLQVRLLTSIAKCSKGYLESGLSGSCWPELRLTRLFWEDEDSRSSHLEDEKDEDKEDKEQERRMTRYMTGGTRRRGEASDLPVLVHCRTVAGGSRLFEDPFLLAPILAH